MPLENCSGQVGWNQSVSVLPVRNRDLTLGRQAFNPWR
jgi:hypothetical protein